MTVYRPETDIGDVGRYTHYLTKGGFPVEIGS